MYEASERLRAGDIDYFGRLSALELQALVPGRDEDGRTLLHSASAIGSITLLELLVKNGAAKVVNKQDDEVGPAAILALCRGA